VNNEWVVGIRHARNGTEAAIDNASNAA